MLRVQPFFQLLAIFTAQPLTLSPSGSATSLRCSTNSLSTLRALSSAAQPLSSAAPETMKAAVYSNAEPQGVKIAKRPIPTVESLRRNQVLCQVKYAGVNPVDAKFLVGDKLPHWLHGLGRNACQGKIVGFDFSGVITGVPTGCTEFKIGDEVYGTVPPYVGTFCEHIKAPIDQVSRKPSTLDFAEAAALPLVGITSIQALTVDNQLSEGQHLLLIGASGGVGHMALQIAKNVGARVTAICSSKNKEWVERLGADSVIDYTQGDKSIVEELLQITKNHGLFNLCMDCVSSREGKDRVFRYEELVRKECVPSVLSGKYVTIGGAPVDWLRAGLKRTIGLNLFSSTSELFWIRFHSSQGILEKLASIAEKGALKPRISSVVQLTDAGVQEAFDGLMSRRVIGKIVVKVDENLQD